MAEIIEIPTYLGEARLPLNEYDKMRDRIRELEEENKRLTDTLDHVPKKIVQKSDDEMETSEESLGIDSVTYNKIVDECIYGKSAWSEEDEIALQDALWCCKQAASIANDDNDMGNVLYAERWLKSLKPQLQWKPSEEQIQALEYQIHSTYEGSWQYKALKELLEQLKKL